MAELAPLNQELASVLEDQINQVGGLSASDYAVLVPLSESPNGMRRARDLGREILWDRSRLSHHVSRMEKRGLGVREEYADDALGAMVRMTEAGRAAIEGAAPGTWRPRGATSSIFVGRGGNHRTRGSPGLIAGLVRTRPSAPRRPNTGRRLT